MSDNPPTSSAIENYVNSKFSAHLLTIDHHCSALGALLDKESLQESLLDLGRIKQSSSALSALLTKLYLSDAYVPDKEVYKANSKIRHDLRTPLNAIAGYTEMISETSMPSPQIDLDEHCEGILSTVKTLLTAIDDLVHFLQGEIGSVSADPKVGMDLVPHLERIGQISDARKRAGKLLVVDDVEANRQLLVRLLSRDGHDVSLAESGAVALEMIGEENFDLILLDIMMPDLNGLEVLEHLKSSEKHKQIPIIVISGLADMDAIAPCIAAGAEDFLTKPFNSVLLRARINSSLEKKMWGDLERNFIKQIENEKQKTETILQAILPPAIIDRLKASDEPIADRLDNVTVLFADIVGFTTAAEKMKPEEVLTRLDSLFSEFDRFTEVHGVEKIKTIGDAYMVASGAPLPVSDHVDRILDMAESILSCAINADRDHAPLQLRIGIHTGPVVAGLIGRHRYVYDLWGETVNVASRIESNGIANQICVSSAIVNAASDRFRFKSCGDIDLKGIGPTAVHMLIENH